ncbi:MAG: DUF2130 domain-containing protein [Candidatus Binatia bacterium]|nr:DUF2130 domain-containing protein [Candidatus Binatia bacterium]
MKRRTAKASKLEGDIIRCPKCGAKIPISAALATQIRAELEDSLEREMAERMQKAVEMAKAQARRQAEQEVHLLREQLQEVERKAAEARRSELALRKEKAALEERARELDLEIARRVQAERAQWEQETRQLREQLQKKIQAAKEQSREEVAQEIQALREQLAEQRRKAAEARRVELELRKEKAALEERARELDLEVARRVEAEKAKVEEQVRRIAAEQQALKLREKDKQIEDLRREIAELQRKSQQGSQEVQGEVLELDIEQALQSRFPQDVLRPVPRGVRGADIIQEVRSETSRNCGTIIWETKNTKHWQANWLQKLKDDQRAVGASVAVLVSLVLPDGVRSFECIEGVWVTDIHSFLPLAAALREQLIHVEFARSAAESKGEKMDMLYRYLAGDEFRERVRAIVETFQAMQTQLLRERRAMEKLWKEREKQIERLTLNTVGMYGAIRGIIGSSLPEIPALALEGPEEPED